MNKTSTENLIFWELKIIKTSKIQSTFYILFIKTKFLYENIFIIK